MSEVVVHGVTKQDEHHGGGRGPGSVALRIGVTWQRGEDLRRRRRRRRRRTRASGRVGIGRQQGEGQAEGKRWAGG